MFLTSCKKKFLTLEKCEQREKKQSTSTENDSVDISNEAIVSLSKQQHEEFLSSARSRLTKLQVLFLSFSLSFNQIDCIL